MSVVKKLCRSEAGVTFFPRSYYFNGLYEIINSVGKDNQLNDSQPNDSPPNNCQPDDTRPNDTRPSDTQPIKIMTLGK
jgi:hypothetical protein